MDILSLLFKISKSETKKYLEKAVPGNADLFEVSLPRPREFPALSADFPNFPGLSPLSGATAADRSFAAFFPRIRGFEKILCFSKNNA